MNYFMSYLNVDVWAEVNTVSGGITYTIVENGKPVEFSSLVDVKRHIAYNKLKERQR